MQKHNKTERVINMQTKTEKQNQNRKQMQVEASSL